MSEIVLLTAAESGLGAAITAADVAAVGGAVASAAGAVSAGQSQSAMANYNAMVAQRDAEQAKVAAQFEETRQRQTAAALRGSQRAAFSKAGLQLEGSPLLVMAESQEEAEMDALVLRHSGSVAEARSRSQAALDRLQGKSARAAGVIGAGSSLLTGVSRVGLR